MTQELVGPLADRFAARFGGEPRWIASAPGRVNLIGEHTDYNGGWVLPMAIDRETRAAGRLAPGRRVRVFSAALDDADELDARVPILRATTGWTNYVRGVLAGFQARGADIPGLDLLIESTLPIGSGLSSSASLTVAVATLLEAATGLALDPVEKALLCQSAEHEFAGVPCGIMDPFASTLCREGRLLLLDCRSRRFHHVPLSDPSATVLVADTGVRRQLARGEYAARRAECEAAARVLGVEVLRDATMDQLKAAKGRLPASSFRRARHVLSEIERTERAALALRDSRLSEAGALMYESHASLRDDFEVSCPELDCIVEAARSLGEERGVLGARMTGGGFGGCAVALVRADSVPAIAASLAGSVRAALGREPAIFVSRPAAGARLHDPIDSQRRAPRVV